MRHVWVLAAALALAYGNEAGAEVWPTAITRVEQRLRSPEPAVRREAAAELSRLPASRVRAMLPRALADNDPEVRVAAGRAAIRVGVDAHVQAESWLSDADPAVRQVAAQMLGAGVPPTGAVTALARTLSDPVATVRLEAARALANAPTEDGARVLLNHLDDPHEAFALAVIDALATLRSPSSVLTLVGKISDPRVNVRRAIVRALGEFEGSSQVTMPLMIALADSDPDVRRLAIESSVAARVFDAMPALEERVRLDRDVDVQAAALSGLLALAALAPEGPSRTRAAELAVECFSHERQELRSEALAALSEYPEVADAQLRSCLATASGELVGQCSLALASLRDQENAELFIAAWRQGRILAPALLAALVVQQGDHSLLMVLELLNSKAPGIRARAVEVVGELLHARGGDGRAVEPVVEALRKAETSADAEALVTLLGRTRSPRAAQYLLPFLNESNSDSLRLAAVQALGEIKGAQVPAPVVERLLTKDDAALRTATTIALREGEWRGTSALLLRLLAIAKLDEAEGLASALWGPARHVRRAQDAARIATLIASADGRARDALIEALARVDWKISQAAWRRLASRGSCARLAKVAEVLGAYPEAVSLLVPLTRSACVDVAANAVWALGYSGGIREIPQIEALVGHADRSVAGNAIATLARVATRSRNEPELSRLLCEQVHLATLGSNAARAANALFGLRHMGRRCGEGADERALLTSSTAPQVRLQAAWLLRAVPSPGDIDRKVLRHCVRRDVDGQVASACLEPRGDAAVSSPAANRATTILVVPTNRTKPEPKMPFALLTEDGAYRFGWTDARGAVWLKTTTTEAVSLSQPVGHW